MTERKDIIAGRFFRAKKNDGTPAKFFYIGIYELDAKSGEPIQTGTKKIGTGKEAKEYPQFKIAKFYRIAESSMMKVATDEAGACNVYQRVY